MKFVKVENNPGLVRDVNSGAILNVDEDAYSLHKKKKREAQQKIAKEQATEARINNLENDVKELKTGIAKILDILTNGNN